MRNEVPKEELLLQKLQPKTPGILEIESRLENDGRLGINIGSLEGAFLQTLASQKNVEKVVEIGTQYGCSTTYLAQGLGQGGKIFAIEKDLDCLRNANVTFEGSAFRSTGCSIELLSGEARDSLSSIEGEGPFDLVFIDANKSGYFEYYQWARRLLRPGGYLVADNVFLFGTQFQNQCPEGTPKKMWSVMNEFLQTIFKDALFQSSLIPTQEGLLFAVKGDDPVA